MKTYLVGGAVRDKLLGRPVHEHDWVVVGATPEQLLAQGYSQVGRDFPVFLHPQTKEEYALARTERKSGRGYGGFVCDFSPEITLESDLLRRDLTINAIAEDADGSLIDPYGGQADLQARLLRHVSLAFREDPLRVLRVARFACRYAPLGFTIAPETLDLMRTIANDGELQELTPERVWKETERALGEAQPQVYFRVLRDCGALAVLFPEIDRLFGVPSQPSTTPRSTPASTPSWCWSRPPGSVRKPGCVLPPCCTTSARRKRRPMSCRAISAMNSAASCPFARSANA